jgi:hypothetical protein
MVVICLYLIFELNERPDHALVIAQDFDNLDIEIIELDSELVPYTFPDDIGHEVLELFLGVFLKGLLPGVSSKATS